MSAEDWRPTASAEALRGRAAVLRRIRDFFHARGVTEVETPAVAAATVPDLHLAGPTVRLPRLTGEREWYLQTSPEYAMKRLLAAGSGPVFQLGKAFRDGEAGARHNPEFTLLEWYRPGWDHHRLMDEVEELLCEILGTVASDRVTYAELFRRELGVDPWLATVADLTAVAGRAGIEVAGTPPNDADTWLQLLLAERLEPRLGHDRPFFLYDFPPSQAALARIRPGDPPVAERFEVYGRGVELANGYHELTDAAEQRRRFELDRAERRRRGLPSVELDERFLAALEHGLPPCAGVALGVDRLVMLALGASRLDEVLAFPLDRA